MGENINNVAPFGPLLRMAARTMSGRGSSARLSILIYHRVMPQADALCPDIADSESFDWQMGLLARHFRPLPLREAAQRLRDGTLPDRAVCVTFDDGYADNHDVALPILRKRGVPATFFVANGFLDGGCMWNDAVIEVVRRAAAPLLDLEACGLGRHAVATPADRRRTLAELIGRLKYLPVEERRRKVDELVAHTATRLPDLMMRRDQVRALHAAGMEIGGHTVNHPILARTDDALAREEIATNRERLEEIIRAPVRLFAYPNGRPRQDFEARHVRMVCELGFEAAVTTAWGTASAATPAHQLPRFTPWDRTPLRFTLRLIGGYRRRPELVS
jgi:peptidoglycan/xylan/chitin deacetylase (PgdA/CDA1 family)